MFFLFFFSCTPNLTMPSIPALSGNTTILKEKKDRKMPKEHAKYNQYYIIELYNTILSRDPTPSELATWLNVLDQNGSREGIYRALVLDVNYLDQINESEIPSQMSLFLERLNKFLEPSNKFRFFPNPKWIALNRIDKALDVFDHLNLNDALIWYAHLSSMLATNYSSVLGQNIRSETDIKTHYLWAKRLPLQYIKSEIIIKINKVINNLE